MTVVLGVLDLLWSGAPSLVPGVAAWLALAAVLATALVVARTGAALGGVRVVPGAPGRRDEHRATVRAVGLRLRDPGAAGRVRARAPGRAQRVAPA